MSISWVYVKCWGKNLSKASGRQTNMMRSGICFRISKTIGSPLNKFKLPAQSFGYGACCMAVKIVKDIGLAAN